MNLDTLVTFKLASALVIFITSLVAGIIPLKHYFSKSKHIEFSVAEALASGFFLGAALLHMLNEANQEFVGMGYQYPFAYLLAGIIFLFLLSLEHIAKEISEHNGVRSVLFVIIAVGMMSFHALFEGIALGLRERMSLAIIVFVAIIAHKWVESFSLGLQITKNQISKGFGLLLFVLYILMTPVGILFGSMIQDSGFNYHILEPIFGSLAAGTFLYIGTLHGLNRSVLIEKCCNLKEYIFVLIGFAIMAIVVIWS